jgi:hypothetical protein
VNGERIGTAQQRVGEGIGKAIRHAFSPDSAADDVLGGLIDQLKGLPWPKSSAGEGPLDARH